MQNDKKEVTEPIFKDNSTLLSLKHERITPFQRLALVKNIKTGAKFWRHRYYLSTGKMTHLPAWEDFPFEQFKDMRELKTFIKNQKPFDGQIFPTGPYWYRNHKEEEE